MITSGKSPLFHFFTISSVGSKAATEKKCIVTSWTGFMNRNSQPKKVIFFLKRIFLLILFMCDRWSIDENRYFLIWFLFSSVQIWSNLFLKKYLNFFLLLKATTNCLFLLCEFLKQNTFFTHKKKIINKINLFSFILPFLSQTLCDLVGFF